jgi:hypothetical protein
MTKRALVISGGGSGSTGGFGVLKEDKIIFNTPLIDDKLKLESLLVLLSVNVCLISLIIKTL